MRPSRRWFLGLGAATSALGYVGWVSASWWNATAGDSYRFLSVDEAAFLRALSACAFPAGEHAPLGGGTADLDHFLDDLLVSLPLDTRNQLRWLLNGLNQGVTPLSPSKFTDLEHPEKEAAFAGWMHHDLTEIRSAVQALVVLLGMGYTTHPQVAGIIAPWTGCGYAR